MTKLVIISTQEERTNYQEYADYLLTIPFDSADEATLLSLYQEKEQLNLVITGGHGDMSVDGTGTLINNCHPIEFAAFFQNKLNALKFERIWVTSCNSAAFIPMLSPYLTHDGVIIAQLLSSLAHADLSHYNKKHDFLNHYFESLSRKVDNTDLLLGPYASDLSEENLPFLSECIYVHRKKTMYRFSHTSVQNAISILNIITAADENPDRIDELNGLIHKLKISSVIDDCQSRSVCELRSAVHHALYSPVPAPENIALSLMKEDDLAAIAELEETIFPDEVAFTIDQLRTYFSKEYSFVLRNNIQEIVGYIFAYKQPNGEFFIGNFGVLPNYAGNGAGSKLLKQVLALADEEHSETKLQVKKTNDRAKKLYQRNGFEVKSENSQYLQMTRHAHPYTEEETISILLKDISNLVNHHERSEHIKEKVRQLMGVLRAMQKHSVIPNVSQINILFSIKTILNDGNQSCFNTMLDQLQDHIMNEMSQFNQKEHLIKLINNLRDAHQDQPDLSCEVSHSAEENNIEEKAKETLDNQALQDFEKKINTLKEKNHRLYLLCQELLLEIRESTTPETKAERTLLLKTLTKALQNPSIETGRETLLLGNKILQNSKQKHLGTGVILFGTIILAMASVAIGLLLGGVIPPLVIGSLVLGKITTSLALGGVATGIAATPISIQWGIRRYSFLNNAEKNTSDHKIGVEDEMSQDTLTP